MIVLNIRSLVECLNLIYCRLFILFNDLFECEFASVFFSAASKILLQNSSSSRVVGVVHFQKQKTKQKQSNTLK